MKCVACNTYEMTPVELANGWAVCMDCTRARQRAAMSHKCVCGPKKVRLSPLHRIGSRTWVSCLRCLGQVAQYS